MIMIIGSSDKLDGIIFLADTDDKDTAYNMLVENWNNNFTDKMKIIKNEQLRSYGIHQDNDYLLSEDTEIEAIVDFEDGMPRREGWQLITQEIEIGSITQGMPW